MLHVIKAATIVISVCAALQTVGEPRSSDLGSFLSQTMLDAQKGNLPSAEAAARVLDQIQSVSEAQIQRATPQIEEALRSSDPSIKRLGIITIYCIDQRPDSGVLVKPLVDDLMSLVNDHDVDLAALAVRSVFSMKPIPPKGTDTTLVEHLQRTDTANVLGATIVFALARIWPETPSSGLAVSKFMARTDLPTDIRVACHNALAVKGLKNVAMISQAAQDVVNDNREVQLAAIHAVSTIGPEAVGIAMPLLSRVANDEKRDLKTREAARNAMNGHVVDQTP